MSERGGLSADTQALLAFESTKKSTGLAFVLWFFTGGVGGHRFYLGKTGSAVAQLCLSVFGWLFVFAAGAGFLLLIPLGIWLLVDLFMISGMVQEHNRALMNRLNQVSATTPVSAVDELAKFAELRDKGAISDSEYEAEKARLLGRPLAAPEATSDTPI